MARPTANLLDEYSALTERRKSLGLSAAGEERLELLRDVLLELGALPSNEQGREGRVARVEAVLEVSFGSSQEVVRAYSKDIGVGGIAIKTERPLQVGSALELRIKLPGGPLPLVAQGKVVWAAKEAMGVEFVALSKADDQRLKEHLVHDERLLQRIRSTLTRDVRQLGKERAPAPVEAAEVDTRPLVLVRLSDLHAQEVVLELLRQAGVRAAAAANELRPAVIVADGDSAVAAAPGLGTKLVLVNVSGPDSLVGSLARLRPAAYIRRRAPATEILQAVTTLLEELSAR